MFYFIYLLSIILPTPGNIYYKNFNIPLIGSQYIETEIITNNFARIKLDGLINDNGSVKYIIEDNKEIIRVSHNLKKIMIKYNTDFSDTYYDSVKDLIIFNLNIKLFNYKKKIIMEKKNKNN